MNDRGALRYAAQRLVLLAVFAGLLFGAAGTVDWPRGWASVLVLLLVEVVTLALFAQRAPAMLVRRGHAGAGVERYDRVVAGLYVLIALVTASCPATRTTRAAHGTASCRACGDHAVRLPAPSG